MNYTDEMTLPIIKNMNVCNSQFKDRLMLFLFFNSLLMKMHELLIKIICDISLSLI